MLLPEARHRHRHRSRMIAVVVLWIDDHHHRMSSPDRRRRGVVVVVAVVVAVEDVFGMAVAAVEGSDSVDVVDVAVVVVGGVAAAAAAMAEAEAEIGVQQMEARRKRIAIFDLGPDDPALSLGSTYPVVGEEVPEERNRILDVDVAAADCEHNRFAGVQSPAGLALRRMVRGLEQ